VNEEQTGKLKRCFKVRPAHGGQWLIVTTLRDLDDMIEDPDTFEIVPVEMSEAELEALGEFSGW